MSNTLRHIRFLLRWLKGPRPKDIQWATDAYNELTEEDMEPAQSCTHGERRGVAGGHMKVTFKQLEEAGLKVLGYDETLDGTRLYHVVGPVGKEIIQVKPDQQCSWSPIDGDGWWKWGKYAENG